MSFKRRDFLKLAAAGAGGFAVKGIASGAAAQTSALSRAASASGKLGSLNGQILAVGFDGNRHPGAVLSGKVSVLSEIDVASGKLLRQQVVPIPNLHLAIRVPGAGDVVLPLDGPAAMLLAPGGLAHTLTAPDGLWFSGHGLLAKDGKRLFLSLRRIEAKTEADTGAILVLEVPSLRTVALWDSGGVRPHDMVWHAETQLLISHYGDMTPAAPAPKSRHPRLVTLDTLNGKVLSTIDTPRSGSLTHIAYDGERFVCGVPLHYFPFDDAGLAQQRQAFGNVGVEVSPAERWEGRLAAPMPPLLIDRLSGEVTAVTAEPIHQRRAQSVIFHPETRTFWITYSFSDVVARIDPATKQVDYLSGFDLGLTCVRGLCALGDGIHIAVSGELNDLSIVNAKTRAVATRIRVPLYDNPHLTFVPG